MINKVILIIEYTDRPPLVLSSDSHTRLKKFMLGYEGMVEQLGIKGMRIERLIDLDEFQHEKESDR